MIIASSSLVFTFSPLCIGPFITAASDLPLNYISFLISYPVAVLALLLRFSIFLLTLCGMFILNYSGALLRQHKCISYVTENTCGHPVLFLYFAVVLQHTLCVKYLGSHCFPEAECFLCVLVTSTWCCSCLNHPS